MKQLKRQTQALERESRIVTRAFIAQECVRSVHLVPGEQRANLFETSFDQIPAFEGNMRILPPPDVQQLAVNLAGFCE